jgi:hypothetical protein
VQRLDDTAIGALKLGLDAQPLTAAKVAFAWRIATGPAMARAGTPSWDGTILTISTTSDTWRREFERARPVVLRRLIHLLGPGAVKTIRVLKP